MSKTPITTVGDWMGSDDGSASLQIAIHDGWSSRWSYAGRLADYVASYFRAELHAINDEQASDAAAFLTYAVNEMVENAVKFGSSEQIDLHAKLMADQLLIIVSSRAQADAAQRYQQIVEEIAMGDPLALLMQRVESNALAGPSAGSGLGLLSMMTDYGASLGWRFQPVQNATVAISTMARLPIN